MLAYAVDVLSSDAAEERVCEERDELKHFEGEGLTVVMLFIVKLKHSHLINVRL